MERLDGVIIGFNKDDPGGRIEIRKISDGLSKTVLVGEALHNVVVQAEKGRTPESAIGDHKDVWYIGGDDPDIYNDSSEALGSTGVPINLHIQFTCNRRQNTAQECQALQIGFSSAHPGITQIVLCDGSVQRIDDSIAPAVWSAMGTRDGQTREGDAVVP